MTTRLDRAATCDPRDLDTISRLPGDVVEGIVADVLQSDGVIDDGSGSVGVIVRQALRDDSEVAVRDIVAIVIEAQVDAAGDRS